MTKRKKHPIKEIEAAIQVAEEKRWRFREPGNASHAWGRLLCPKEDREGCSMSIWSTPKVPENHAKQILRNVKSCPHKEEENSK